MRRSYDHYSPANQHGWDRTSHDYHDHVSRIERMPSVLADVPHYPNVHKVFKRNAVTHQEEEHNSKKKHGPVFQDKVEAIKYEEESDRSDRAVNYEESVDSEADGFIQRKHKGFQMCKWSTFRIH